MKRSITDQPIPRQPTIQLSKLDGDDGRRTVPPSVLDPVSGSHEPGGLRALAKAAPRASTTAPADRPDLG